MSATAEPSSRRVRICVCVLMNHPYPNNLPLLRKITKDWFTKSADAFVDDAINVIEIASVRVWTPNELDPTSLDGRSLGVGITGLEFTSDSGGPQHVHNDGLS